MKLSERDKGYTIGVTITTVALVLLFILLPI